MNLQVAKNNIKNITANEPETKITSEKMGDFKAQRSKILRIWLGISIALCAISPVHAQLSGTGLDAARAYFANYPWIPVDKQNEILRKDNLQQVSDYLNTNTYWDGSKNVLLPVFDPAARMQTAITGNATMPMTSLITAKPTLVKNDPTGVPTYQISEATHLDGNHNTTESVAAQQAALQQHVAEVAAYQHNDPTGVPTHQIGEATHLDGNHNTAESATAQQVALQQHVAEVAAYQHNDPTGVPTHQIGEATHFDGNHNMADSIAAKQAALQKHVAEVAAYQHNDPTGVPTHQIGEATHLDGNHNTAESATAQQVALQQHVAEVAAYQHNDPTGVPVPTPPATNASDDEPANTIPAGNASTSAQKTVAKKVVRSAYYDQQVAALNAEAEQNHAEVLAESHSRAVADAQTLSQANDYTNKKFNDLKSEVDGNKKEAAAGSASAMAQANIPQVQESQQFAIGAGVGGYDSQNAISVGASFHAGRSTIVKMSVSNDSQSNFGYGAGMSVGW
ncbi:YadA C-terminal domain-containing protein [Rahnella woolbedingensis]|uniref:YadA C-terminal domain-containing protein n=1 Tax=Rahnella woolbedingensis TaxID=1510574 RepID=UPI001FCA1D0A|nr:YadA C-terminal domain-containing protein [Rahnella woolbedingensis]